MCLGVWVRIAGLAFGTEVASRCDPKHLADHHSSPWYGAEGGGNGCAGAMANGGLPLSHIMISLQGRIRTNAFEIPT